MRNGLEDVNWGKGWTTDKQGSTQSCHREQEPSQSWRCERKGASYIRLVGGKEKRSGGREYIWQRRKRHYRRAKLSSKPPPGGRLKLMRPQRARPNVKLRHERGEGGWMLSEDLFSSSGSDDNEKDM